MGRGVDTSAKPLRIGELVTLESRNGKLLGQARCYRYAHVWSISASVGSEVLTIWAAQRPPSAVVMERIRAKHHGLRGSLKPSEIEAMPVFQLTRAPHTRYYGCQVWWYRAVVITS